MMSPEVTTSQCDLFISEKEDPSMTRGELERALIEARPHVWRQQHGGVQHEQDRVDAVKWLEKWGPSIEKLRNKNRGVDDERTADVG
jgi:hypothetical protein